MREFPSMAALGLHFGTLIVAEVAAAHHALERSAVLVEKTAKGKLGTYQPGWANLAQSTLDDKANKGYPTPSPLLRDAAMRESIEHQVSGLEAQVGSNSQIAVWQELGTSKMPPRSFLALSASEKAHEIVDIVGEAVFLSLCGEGVLGGRLAID